MTPEIRTMRRAVAFTFRMDQELTQILNTFRSSEYLERSGTTRAQKLRSKKQSKKIEKITL